MLVNVVKNVKLSKFWKQHNLGQEPTAICGPPIATHRVIHREEGHINFELCTSRQLYNVCGAAWMVHL
jgi:hypothetical protein